MTRALAVALLLTVGAALWLWGSKNTVEGERDAAVTAKATAEAELKATQGVLETERLYSQKLQSIATRYEGDKNEIERQAAADRAGLLAGNLRLRQQWQGCEAGRVPGTGAGSSEPDATTADRAEGASDLVRAAAQCDAQVRGLQAVITADREPLP